MFSKRRFRRRNKPSSQHFLEGGEQQQETPFIPPVQTKLNIGKPGDVYEVEADKTADAVVAKTDTTDSIQKMGAEEEEVQAKPLSAGLTPFVQKQEAPEEEEPVQAMAEKEEEEPVQMQEEEEESVQTKEEEEDLQAKSENGKQETAGLEKNLKNMAGQGFGLPKATKARMENAFGTDFSQVRIHTDGRADRMNKRLQSRAFTHGLDIYFKSGNFRPDTEQGEHLMAHELTHTLQQGAIDIKAPAGKTDKSLSRTRNTVQLATIKYGERSLEWTDYQGEYKSDHKHSANSDIHIYMDRKKDVVHSRWQQTGDTSYDLIITYKPSSVSVYAIFTQEESSKEVWLTDDEAARAKLGHDNIQQARADLLAHEQVHFRNAHIVAQKYDPVIKAAVPTALYIESITAKDSDEADIKRIELASKKGTELDDRLSEIRQKAEDELSEIQSLYDQDTDHGRLTERQQRWADDFEKAIEEARTPTAKKEEGDLPSFDD